MAPFRKKLLFLLALPIVVIYSIVAAIQVQLESDNVVRQAELLINEKVAHHAALCDTVFTKAAESAMGLADYIEVANPKTTKEVTAYIATILQQHPIIVGSTVAYDPHQFPGYDTYHSPYLYKPDSASDVGEMVGVFRCKDLAVEEDYTKYDWYSAPIREKKPVWSEPYYDAAGALSLMCTYSVPIFTPSGELKCVATIDISLNTFREIVSQVNAKGAECILFSKQGTVIASPNADWDMKATLDTLMKKWDIPDPEGLINAIRTGQTGSRNVYSAGLREDVFFSFAPLPASGWSALVLMHKRTIMEEVYKKAFTSTVVFFVGIVVLVLAIRYMVSQTGSALNREVTQATEANMREHEAFVKDVFTSIQDGIFVFDRNYTILRTNPTFNAMYPELLPLVGRKCWETSGLDHICDDCPAKKMFRSGKLELSIHYEEPTATRKGAWLEHFSYPIFDDSKNIVGGINFVRDISERKEMEAEIQRYQANLEHIVEERTTKLNWSESKMQAVLAGSVPIIFYSPNGIAEAINPAMENLIGYTESEIVGQNVMGLVQEEYRKPMGDLLQQFVINNAILAPRLDIPVVHKDGHQIWCDCSITGIYDDAGTLILLVIISMDITEKRKLLENLEVAKYLAEQSTRAKGEFLANMSHEIRTPMNAILGMTYLCLQTDLNDKQREYLEKAESATKNLLRIIDDILDFSKIEAGKLTIEKVPFRLSDAFSEVIDVVALTARNKGISLDTKIDESAPNDLIGDPLRVRQVLLNLAGNAVKFTESGTVSIAVERLPDDERAAATDDVVWLSFTVRDTGIGMNDEQMQRLFTSFSQADTSTTRKYGGTGLGLAISRNLVEMMGGKINVSSEIGRGTSFCFKLPFTVCALAQQLPKDEAEHDSDVVCDFTGTRVLLAEDNKVNQIVARGLLQMFNVELTIANDGLEAVELVKSNDFDLVLMDVQMPNLDGLEATRAIRKLDKPGIDKLPILAMTAHAMQSDFEQSISAGMNDHLTKPIDPTKLRKALTKWLSKHTTSEHAQSEHEA
ncbi:MAG: ATP-binding protein [Thermoguttaceae bacterium]